MPARAFRFDPAAGIPMMPNIAGPASTRRQILAYTCIVTPVALLPSFLGFGGWLYLGVAAVTGLAMLALAWRVLKVTEGEPAMKAAQALFAFSILYLTLLFAVLLAENAFGLMWPLAMPDYHLTALLGGGQ